MYLKSCAYHPDSECCTFFHEIWATRRYFSLKIHWYTCMSFETCWSRLIYTEVSSHLSFVINMYVVTMAWRCVFLWSFHRSPQRRREMNIFGYISRFRRILSKKNPKKRRKPQLNARKHWESKSRNRSLSAAVLHVKPSRHNSNLYYSRENHHKVEILNYSVSLQYRKRNRDFITINFQNLAFFRESFTCSNVILALSLEIYFPWQ